MRRSAIRAPFRVRREREGAPGAARPASTACLSRRAFLATGAATAAVLLAAPATAEAVPTFLRIGTGSTSGTYFPVGSLIAGVISNPPGTRPCDIGGNCGVPGVIAAAQATKGSLDNIRRLTEGSVDLALTQADIAYWAYTGSGAFEGTAPKTAFRAVARLYPEAVHLVVRADSEIQSVVDLKGRRVSGGDVGSGTLVDAEILMAAYGIGPDDYRAFHLSPAESADNLLNGEIDAFFMIAGHPTRVIEDLASRLDIRLISITGSRADEIIAAFPYFGRTQIPAALYRDVPLAQTLAVGALLVARADMPEELVYLITEAVMHARAKAIYETGHPMAAEINLASALDSVAIPLHPGAARFYDEVGLLGPATASQ